MNFEESMIVNKHSKAKKIPGYTVLQSHIHFYILHVYLSSVEKILNIILSCTSRKIISK